MILVIMSSCLAERAAASELLSPLLPTTISKALETWVLSSQTCCVNDHTIQIKFRPDVGF